MLVTLWNVVFYLHQPQSSKLWRPKGGAIIKAVKMKRCIPGKSKLSQGYMSNVKEAAKCRSTDTGMWAEEQEVGSKWKICIKKENREVVKKALRAENKIWNSSELIIIFFHSTIMPFLKMKNNLHRHAVALRYHQLLRNILWFMPKTRACSSVAGQAVLFLFFF